MKRKKLHGSRWHPEKCLDKASVRQMYVDSLSTRQISRLIGYSHGHIHKICQDISRDRTEAVRLALPSPKDTKHWRTCRARARKIMENHLGRKLDRLEYVHHIDEDFTNNDIENLEVLSPREHKHRHHPDWEVPRHLRPQRREYMKAYLAVYSKTYRRKKRDAAER